MDGNVIEFDRDKARQGLANKTAQLSKLAVMIQSLRIEVEAAQQAYQSGQLVRGGYCGSGLKNEIEQAKSLPG